MKPKLVIAPSILAADLAKPVDAVKLVERYGLRYLHFDIMDGHFVPNITFGPQFVQAIAATTKLKPDIHLMIENPEKFIDEFMKARPEIMTFHYEAVHFAVKLIEELRRKGLPKVGISLNPSTQIQKLKDLLPFVDLVLVMTVEPGFYGQPIIPDIEKKTAELAKMREAMKLKFLIEADGGIDEKTYLRFEDHIDMAVLGAGFFRNPNRDRFMKELGITSR